MGLPEQIRAVVTRSQTQLLHLENETFLFPAVSNVTVTFSAGGVANVFGAWVEIADNLGVTFSSVFAAQSGYICEVMCYTFSIANEVWIIELSYGATNITLGRQRVRSDWTYLLPLLCRPVPAGEVVYYRAMSQTALATCLVNFRYFYLE